MTSREVRACGPKKRAHFSADHDQQILTFREWCDLNSISARTGRRILHAPGAPTVTMLTKRCMGISIGNNKIWQEQRARRVVAR
jgi:hypothetical protein